MYSIYFRWIEEYSLENVLIVVLINKGSQEEKELTGTIDDIKDFMFVVTDDKDTPYSFTFDEKPDGLEGVASGDKVNVKYTGTISEVDPFEGKIICERAKGIWSDSIIEVL